MPHEAEQGDLMVRTRGGVGRFAKVEPGLLWGDSEKLLHAGNAWKPALRRTSSAQLTKDLRMETVILKRPSDSGLVRVAVGPSTGQSAWWDTLTMSEDISLHIIRDEDHSQFCFTPLRGTSGLVN